MDPRDLKVLAALEGGLPLVHEPFAEIGRNLSMSGQEVLERARRLQEGGVIRKFRARINQRQLGIAANALVAWNCNGMSAIEAGARLAAFPGVTHCYERAAVPGRWEYRLYTVHHGYSREEVVREVRQVAEAAGLNDYLILFSTGEYKRVPNARVSRNGGGA